jgi:hypothetical protein
LRIVGSFTFEPVPANPADLIFNEKSIEGHFIFGWLQRQSQEELAKHVKEIHDDIKAGGKIYGSEI